MRIQLKMRVSRVVWHWWLLVNISVLFFCEPVFFFFFLFFFRLLLPSLRRHRRYFLACSRRVCEVTWYSPFLFHQISVFAACFLQIALCVTPVLFSPPLSFTPCFSVTAPSEVCWVVKCVCCSICWRLRRFCWSTTPTNRCAQVQVVMLGALTQEMDFVIFMTRMISILSLTTTQWSQQSHSSIWLSLMVRKELHIVWFHFVWFHSPFFSQDSHSASCQVWAQSIFRSLDKLQVQALVSTSSIAVLWYL